MMRLCAKIYTDLISVAEKSYPFECCGFLTGHDDAEEVFAVEAVQGRHSYFIDPMTVYGIERSGKNIAGVYHSHPDASAELSGRDKEFMIPEMLYVVMSVYPDGVRDMKGYVKHTDGRILSVAAEMGAA